MGTNCLWVVFVFFLKEVKEKSEKKVRKDTVLLFVRFREIWHLSLTLFSNCAINRLCNVNLTEKLRKNREHTNYILSKVEGPTNSFKNLDNSTNNTSFLKNHEHEKKIRNLFSIRLRRRSPQYEQLLSSVSQVTSDFIHYNGQCPFNLTLKHLKITLYTLF
jgi:hypothetical protein